MNLMLGGTQPSTIFKTPRDARLNVDCLFAVKAYDALRRETQGCHADLWVRIVPHVRSGRLRVRSTLAHLQAVEYARRGLDEEDRLGNAAADAAVGAAAVARLPPPTTIAACGEQLL